MLYGRIEKGKAQKEDRKKGTKPEVKREQRKQYGKKKKKKKTTEISIAVKQGQRLPVPIKITPNTAGAKHQRHNCTSEEFACLGVGEKLGEKR